MNTTTEDNGLSLDELNSNQFIKQEAYHVSEDDSKLYVTFSIENVDLTAESKRKGHLKVAGMEFIQIMVPGDKGNSIKRRVNELDKKRFADRYARFKEGIEDPIVGTPLTELVGISAAKAREYDYFNIKTLEQLAATPDGSQAAQSMMGFQQDKQKAEAFLAMAEGRAPILDMQKKLEERDKMMEEMREQIAALQGTNRTRTATQAKAKE